MDAFLQLPASRRLLAFQQVDETMGLQAVSVEKDFWVCWTLRELFSLTGAGEHLTFKGGTSLSKAWKLIERFSEDIDIIVDKEALGFGPFLLARRWMLRREYAIYCLLSDYAFAPRCFGLLDNRYLLLELVEGKPYRHAEIDDRERFFELMRAAISELPPSGAIAGVYARVDNQRGVWKAPANVSLNSVSGPVLPISSEQQEGLNVDAISGKSVNAIRTFTGKGTLVWGARTLAGKTDCRCFSAPPSLVNA